ncbi:hypothetical protein E2542_SST08917 [Spatholobus suberectus]|nr:hypothetical protein E2542_SST08917 [Spatholobus suberectus]
MLRGVEDKRKAVECYTLDGESLVAESITSLRSDLSSIGNVVSHVNQQGPPYKAIYSWVTDSPLRSEIEHETISSQVVVGAQSGTLTTCLLKNESATHR